MMTARAGYTYRGGGVRFLTSPPAARACAAVSISPTRNPEGYEEDLGHYADGLEADDVPLCGRAFHGGRACDARSSLNHQP